MRRAVVAGTFYPSDGQRLSNVVEKYIKDSKELKVKGKLNALIVPHAGHAYSGIVAGAGYKLLQQKINEGQKFKKVILLGPSHQLYFKGVALANEDFDMPFGKVKCGKKLSKFNAEEIIDLPEAHSKEHSLEVQLPFLQKVLKDWELYAFSVGELDEDAVENIAMNIERFLEQEEEVIIVVSSDLSHYLDYESAVKQDNKTIRKIKSFEDDELDACGREGIRILLKIAKDLGWVPLLIDYKNSGDTAGDKNNVVGYTTIAYVN